MEVLLGARPQPGQVGVEQQGEAPQRLLFRARLRVGGYCEGLLTAATASWPRMLVRCVYAESECNPVVVFSQPWLRTLVVQCNAAEADMSHSKERRGELSVIAILLGFGCRLSCHARSSSGDGITCMPGILRPVHPLHVAV